MGEHGFQGLVETFVLVGPSVDIAKEFRRQNEEPFFFDEAFATFLGFAVGQFGVVKVRVAGFPFSGIDIIRQIFGDISIKHGAEDVIFKIPAIHGPAKFIGDSPNGTVQFLSFLLFFIVKN